jgi:hypothetical protein
MLYVPKAFRLYVPKAFLTVATFPLSADGIRFRDSEDTTKASPAPSSARGSGCNLPFFGSHDLLRVQRSPIQRPSLSARAPAATVKRLQEAVGVRFYLYDPLGFLICHAIAMCSSSVRVHHRSPARLLAEW